MNLYIYIYIYIAYGVYRKQHTHMHLYCKLLQNREGPGLLSEVTSHANNMTASVNDLCWK